MKITSEHIEVVKTVLKGVDKPLVKQTCHEYKTKLKVSAMRFRWDIIRYAFYNANLNINDWLSSVYKYANDEHIDAVLRKFICDDNWSLKIN